jgi:hypothetical protein
MYSFIERAAEGVSFSYEKVYSHSPFCLTCHLQQVLKQPDEVRAPEEFQVARAFTFSYIINTFDQWGEY